MKYFLLLVLISMTIVSCGKKEKIDHKTMRICLKMDPTSIDSRKNADPCTSCLNFLIYEGLTQMGKDGSTELALAESVDCSENGLIYTFHLRDSFWSDGKPITAEDFEHSWKKTLDPKFSASCPNLLYPIKNAEKAVNGTVPYSEVGVKAIDEKTLRVELENPTPYFLSLITFCNFYPIPKHLEMQSASWSHFPSHRLVQSGPFRIVKWQKNKEIILKKNPLYWDAKNIHLDKIHISIIPDERTALQLFLNAELDFLTTLTTPISLEDLAECRRKRILQITPVGGLIFCTFNLERFPFYNVNIRKALSAAIDRKSIAENILQLSEPPATRFIPPILFNHANCRLFPAYDPKQARKFFEKGLEELGVQAEEISDALILSYESQDQNKKIAQAIQHQWKSTLNLDATLYEGDHKSIVQKHMNRDYQVGLDGCIAQYNDPSNILDRFKYKITKKNLPGFENEEYIRLLNEASQMNNPVERFEVLRKAEEILAIEMPFAPLFYYQQGELIGPRLTNLEFSPIGNLLFKKIFPIE